MRGAYSSEGGPLFNSRDLAFAISRADNGKALSSARRSFGTIAAFSGAGRLGSIKMKTQVMAGLMMVASLVGCSARTASPQPLTANLRPTTEIVYVTPTPRPTFVPTAVRFVATDTPQVATEISVAVEPASCDEWLRQQYAAASDQCLDGPSGFFCSGGIAPAIVPATMRISMAPAPGLTPPSSIACRVSHFQATAARWYGCGWKIVCAWTRFWLAMSASGPPVPPREARTNGAH